MARHIEDFLEYLQSQKRYSEHTIIAYRKDINQLKSYLLEQYDLSSVVNATQIMLRSWLVHLMEQKYSPESVNRKIASVRSFYKFLLQRQRISNNPASALRNLRTKSRLPEFLQEKELVDLLHVKPMDSFIDVRDYTILFLVYSCGLRRSEVIELHLEDLHHDHIRIFGKGGKERIVPLTRELKELLENYIKMRDSLDVEKLDSNLFVRKNGMKLYPKLVYNIVQHYLRKFTNLNKKSPHVLRHSFATHMVNRGADINTVKELLGHSSLAATQVYTHTDIEQLKKVYSKAHPKSK